MVNSNYHPHLPLLASKNNPTRHPKKNKNLCHHDSIVTPLEVIANDDVHCSMKVKLDFDKLKSIKNLMECLMLVLIIFYYQYK
jgi:hypothetical protein